MGKSNIANDRSNQLLGEFLTEAGLLQVEELREAANIARNQGLPVGKVLVMSAYISKETLQAAVEIQARIRDGLLDYEIALKALVLVSQNNGQLDDALSHLNWPKINIEISNRLGDLLLGASLVSDMDVKTAMQEASQSGLPLGRVLLNLSMISEPLLNHALNTQAMVREGSLTKEQALRTLIVAKEGQLPASQSGTNHQALKNTPNKPVENPVAQQELNIQAAIPQSAGQRAFLPPNELNKNEPVKKSAPAAGITEPVPPNHAEDNGKKTSQFVGIQSLSLHHMLRVAGLVETDALENAIVDSLEDTEVMTLILRQTKLLEDFVIEAAKECCQLIREGRVKPEQAIIALHHCQRTRNSMHDCLEEFGWLQQPTELVNS